MLLLIVDNRFKYATVSSAIYAVFDFVSFHMYRLFASYDNHAIS